ncbi:hypothetical protein [Micromonospora sp. NBC_01813]|uniref:hypothetical protein n=1 Tax=Micromonospora sp. NBC_01813 TaxID=2975988 RepID=UPI002DD9E2BE|nr:hypothetical protein [Micromonospora sp. NBC_01813]WSA08335.1 hypothetical protein OG958_29780 [Micromonospora sp. NBC_01813]
MQRVRRLASITVIALVGVAALSACRSQPGVAAYVGDQQYSEEQVTDLVDEIAEQLGDQVGQEGAPPLPTRQQVVSALVLADVCRQLDVPADAQQISPDQYSQQTGLPADSEFVEAAAQVWTCITGLQTGELVEPTQEELFDLVDRGRAAGVIPAEVSDSEAASQLDGEQLRTALATRNTISDAVAEQDVTVNPRYRPLEFPVLSFQSNVIAVGIPLGDGDSGTVNERQ